MTNVTGDDVREITCTQNGYVLAIRTYPRVHENDSVIVIMEDIGTDSV